MALASRLIKAVDIIQKRKKYAKMVAWSSILTKNTPVVGLIRNSCLPKSLLRCNGNALVPIRKSGHGPPKFTIKNSSYNWVLYKNYLHFYFLLGAIPALALVAYCNIFIGPATLAVIPEGYEPKHWEYYRHPISRYISWLCDFDIQKSYEMMLHNIYIESEKEKLRKLEKKIDDLQRERMDYQSWYFHPPIVKYLRYDEQSKREFYETSRGMGSGIVRE